MSESQMSQVETKLFDISNVMSKFWTHTLANQPTFTLRNDIKSDIENDIEHSKENIVKSNITCTFRDLRHRNY